MEKSLDLRSRSRFQLKKYSRGRRLREGRISSLPDDILLLIMSFLPMNEVVKTSLLSRRWLNLWVHTPVLHFRALVPQYPLRIRSKSERRDFVEGVNRVLRQHKGQYLKEFKVVYELDKHNQKDIDSWLVIAFAKKVQCLELKFQRVGLWCHNDYVFLDPFLNFGSGKANSDSGKSQFLQSDLKCLKSLSLTRVDVNSEAINFVLLNCPFLERLEVVGTLKLVNLVISDPTLVLKYLKIKYCNSLNVLSISNFNLFSLDISSLGVSSLGVSSPGDLTLTGLPMLVELFIDGSFDRLSQCISQASSCFSQLEAFTLSGLYLKDATQLSRYDHLTKLKRLVISIGVWGDARLTKLISLVNACPRLEEFVFMLRCWSEFEWTRRTTSKVKRRSSSLKSKSLKVFEYVGYQGHATDAELIMRVVENAVSLEKIIIDPRNPLVIDWHIRTARQLEKARSLALQQFDSLRKCVPPHTHLLLR